MVEKKTKIKKRVNPPLTEKQKRRREKNVFEETIKKERVKLLVTTGDVDPDSKLTLQQQAFVNAYLTSRSPEKAALASGYSAHSAHTTGCKLLQKPHIKAAIEYKEYEVLKKNASIDQHKLTQLLLNNHEIAIKQKNLAASNKALELIGKLGGLFKEQIEVNTEYSIPSAIKELLLKAEEEEKIMNKEIKELDKIVHLHKKEK